MRKPLLWIAPSFLLIGILSLYPMGYGIWMAFTNFKPEHIRTNAPRFVGLENFYDLFTGASYLDFNFFSILLFNIVWTLSNLLFHVTIGILLALAIQKIKGGEKIYRTLLILPWAIPAYITCLVWKNMYDPQYGPINQLLHSEIPWLQEFPHAFFSVLITNVWLGFPFMMMVATGALQSISKELYESASVDGASALKQFLSITLPGIKPAMLPAVLLGGIWTFNNFNVIYFITNGGPLGKTEILITKAYALVNPLGLYGVASAFSLVIFAIVLGLTLVQMRVAKVEV